MGKSKAQSMGNPDEVLLARYIDGEMSPDEVRSLTTQVLADQPTQTALSEQVAARSLVKAYGHQIQSETIPSDLSAAVTKRGPVRLSIFRSPLVRSAAILALIIVGYLAGMQTSQSPTTQFELVSGIPIGLEQTINATLEYTQSGEQQSWASVSGDLSAQIRPVQTLRNPQGAFYRFYDLDIAQGVKQSQFRVLAIRAEKEKWVTQGIFNRPIANI